jgi:hypothetical protein
MAEEQKLPPATPEMMKIYVAFCKTFQVTPDELPLMPISLEPDPALEKLQETCKHLAQVAWDAVAPLIWARDNRITAYEEAAKPKSSLILPTGAERRL